MLSLLKQSYYCVKPLVPESLNISLRRKYLNYLRSRCGDIWPIDKEAGFLPPGWRGWPGGKKFAVVLTHDVEGDTGVKKCRQLLELEMELGFRSCFNFVAKDYKQDEALMQFLIANGFEIGLHGINHRGNLFASRKSFLNQKPAINNHLKEWNAVGFRTPSMYHNLEWMHELDIEYDCSTFDTDPFEPQPDGIGTIFPCWIHNGHPDKGYVELPYTLPQDFALFILMQEKDDGIWRKKLDWIAQCGGMALVIVHPDYMCFNGDKPAINQFPAKYYRDFLTYIKEKYEDQYYHVLPREMARFWVKNYGRNNAAIHSEIVKQPQAKAESTDEIIIIDPESDPRWDKFVENHPNGWITHLSGWKKVLENTFSHMRGHYLALIDKDTNVIKAGLPLYEIHSWLTGSRLVSIPFATLCDPLTSNEEQSDALIKKTSELMAYFGCAHIEIRTHANNSFFFNKPFIVNGEYKHHYLDLSKGEELLWKNTSYKSIRYLINKAGKHNIQVKYAQNDEDVLKFYELYTGTRKRLGLPAQPYAFFKGIFDQFKDSEQARILLACLDDKIICGHFHLNFKGRTSVEAMGEDNDFRNIGANQFLYWQGIRTACTQGYRIFDFGRTSIHNSTLIDFKKRWGTVETNLNTYFYVKGQKQIAVSSGEKNQHYKLVRNICKKSPALIYPLVSRFCYHHLG